MKTLIRTAFAALTLGLLAACAGLAPAGDEPAPGSVDQGAAPGLPSPQTPEAPPADQVPKELVFATLTGSIRLDPAHAYTSLESQIYTAVYEGLMTYDPMSLAPRPGAARRWEVSEDGRTYRFFLREDGRFSNGDPVTAKVFQDSWLRVLNPEANAEYSTFYDIIAGARDYRTGRQPDAAKVAIRVVAPYVLEVELERPAPHFLKLLCHMSFVALHPFYHREEGWEQRDSIVGNGPFFIMEKDEGKIVFVRNNLYWDRSDVALDRIVISFMADPGAMSEGFNQGLIHWADHWDSSQVEDTDKIVFNPLFSTSFLFFRSDRAPWDDARVRRALALLVPWENIRNDQVFFPTARLVPQIPDYPDVERIEAPDRDEAMRLLEEAGFPQGAGLPPIVARIPSGGDSGRVLGVMAEAWKEALGVEVTLENVDYGRYFSSLKQEGYTLGHMTWIGDFADPLTFLQMWTTDSNLNDARYGNSEYDALVQDGTAQDGEERYATFGRAESIILRDAVIMPISHQPSLNLIDLERIEGWFPNPLDIHPFKHLKFRGPRVVPNLVMR